MKQLNYFNRTPEELQQEIEAARKLSKYTCTNCGRDYEAAYNVKPIKPIDPEEWRPNPNRDIMEELKVCNCCAFWIGKRRMPIHKPKRRIIFKRVHHISYGWEDRTKGYNTQFAKGYGGAEFYFRMNDGSYYRTNNLWCQGDIPDEFREEFADNCIQITKEEYLKGINNGTD